MKESKLRSFEWLRNIDESEIVEIDMEGDILPAAELLVENQPSGAENPMRKKLDDLYSKFPKSLPKKVTEKPTTTVSNLSQIERWKGIAKEISIISEENFEWLKTIDSETETLAMIEASQGIISEIPCRAIYSALFYWGYESINEQDWMPSMRSVYYMYANKRCEWFYVLFRRFFSIFYRENGKSVVIITNPTASLIASLKKSLVSIPEEEPANENLVKVKEKKKPLRIEGKNIQAFYNYLVNTPGENKIVSPCVFLNAQFKNLTPVCNTEVFSNGEKIYKIGFSGPVTCEMVTRISDVMSKMLKSYCIEMAKDELSHGLPGEVPSKITKKGNEFEVVF